MAKQWSEVAGSSDFAALADEDKDVVRQAYFEKVVAPEVAPDQLDATRERFNSASGFGKRRLPAGVAPSTAGGGRGLITPTAVNPTPQDDPAPEPAPAATVRAQGPSSALADIRASTTARDTRLGLGSAAHGGRGVTQPPLAEDYGVTDDGEPMTPEAAQTRRLGQAQIVSGRQLGKDLLSGVEQVKGLTRSAGAFGGAVDYRATAAVLSDFDAIDAGKEPTATAAPVMRPDGPSRTSEPGAVAKAYMQGTPEQRTQLRAGATDALTRDKGFIADSIKAVQAYSAESKKLSGDMPNFTDIRTVTGFANWLARTGVQGAPTMAAAMVGAAAGPLGFAVTTGGMAVGDMTQARIEHTAAANDPAQAQPSERAEVAANRDENMARDLAKNVGTTAALAVPYSALDMLGPVGAALRGPVKAAVGQTVKQVLKHGAKELPQQIGEEIINEGGQEVVNVISDVLAGERGTDVTKADVLRVINSGAAGAAMAPGGHVANVGAQVVAAARANAAKDVYDAAKEQGFHVEPPLTTDAPDRQRKKTLGIFEGLAAHVGLPKAAVDRAKAAVDGMAAADVGPFLRKLVGTYEAKGLTARPVDAHVIDTLDAGPIAPLVDETKAAQTETKQTEGETKVPEVAPTSAQDQAIGEIERLLGKDAPPVDVQAHTAATSPLNTLDEPTPAQIEAGNYKLGHDRIGGLDISIENPEGSTRKSKPDAPVPWESETAGAHYGYIRGTLAMDGHKIDAFIKPSTPRDFDGAAFVIDQIDPATGQPDEHKVMLGYATMEEAKAAYHANYPTDWKGLKTISATPMAELKTWLAGDTSKPFHQGTPDARQSNLAAPAAPAADPAAGRRDQPAGGERDMGSGAAGTRGAGRDPAAPAPARGLGPAGAVGDGGAGAAPVNRVIAHAGSMPNQTTPIELRTNPDGTHTPWNGGYPILDRVSEQPISIPAGATNQEAVDLIKAARPFGKSTKIFNVQKDAPAPAPVAAPAPDSGVKAPAGTMPTASWVIRERATGKVVMETFDRKKVDALNTAKYEAVPIQEHLASLNRGNAPSNASTPPSAVPSVADIHALAEAKGIAWDRNAEFMAFTKKVTGKSHLDDLNDKQRTKLHRHLSKRLSTAELVAKEKAITEKRRAAAKARMAFNPETDTVLQALAKMGGMSRLAAAKEFGLKPEELQHVVSISGLKGSPFRLNGGHGLDGAITALVEAGYFPGVKAEDLKHALDTAISNELGGVTELTPLGDMRRGADMARDAHAAELERQAADDSDPFAPGNSASTLDPFGADDLEESGYAELSPELAAATQLALAAAEELGIDTELLKENAARGIENEPEDVYHARLQKAAWASVTEVRQSHARAEPGGAEEGAAGRGEAAGDQGDEGQGAAQEGLTLEAQDEAGLRAKTERESAATEAERKTRTAEQERLRKGAEAKDTKVRADQTVDDFKLGQTAEQQLSGIDDLFAEPKTAPAAADEAEAQWTRTPEAERRALAVRAGMSPLTALIRQPWSAIKPERQAKLRAAMNVEPAPVVPAADKIIGQNTAGQDIREDARGVRSITVDGVRNTEAVTMRPTRDKGMQISVEHKGEYLTAEEMGALRKALELPEGQTKQERADSVTALYGPKSVASTWADASPAIRRQLLQTAGYTDSDQARVLSGTDWNQLTDPVRRALSAKSMSEPVGAPKLSKQARADLLDQYDLAAIGATVQYDGKTYEKRTGSTWVESGTNGQPLASSFFVDHDVQGAPKAPVNTYAPPAPKATPAPAAAPTGPPRATTLKAEAGDSDAMRQAKADMLKELGNLGDIFGKSGKAFMLPEQEQKLMPVLTRLFDAALRAGYIKFKEAARYVHDLIRSHYGNEVADGVTLDHLQGAYIGMAGKYRDQGADRPAVVASVESLDELAEKPAPAPDKAPTPSLPPAPAAGPARDIVEHVTKKGKTLRGVVRTDLTRDQAHAIDEYTFKKGDGFFIREEHFAALDAAHPANAPAAKAPLVTPPAASFTDHLYAKIKAGDMPTGNLALKRLVHDFDNAPPTPARMKQAQEALETAIVRSARDVVARKEGQRSTFDILVRLYESQPNLNVRTSNSIERQAYSTPAPLAYVASTLAGITRSSSVAEPTGGNGMLLIAADPAHAFVNEIDQDRAASLREQGFEVTTQDAAVAPLITPKSADVVITNPPFGGLKQKVKVDGYILGQIDHLIAAHALEGMKDDGSATLIIGASKVTGQQSNSDLIFFNWLYSHYNVTSHFEVDGDLYQRQGASWPVRVITIKGRQASSDHAPAPATIERASTWSDVYAQFQQALVAERPAAVPVSTQPGGTRQPRPVPAPAGSKVAQPGGGRPEGGAAGAGNVAGERPGAVGDRGAEPSEPVGERPGAQRPAIEPAADPVVREPGGAGARQPAGTARTIGLTEAENQFQAKYVPRSSNQDKGVLIPVNMAGPTQDALNRLEDEVGDIDEYARTELGYETTEDLHDALMGLQVDSVASAIYQIKAGKGVIIADQTGIGKGRQAAAIIRWTIRSGRVPVFVTVKPSLFTDMHGDLADIGSADVAPFIMNVDQSIKGQGDEKLFANKASEHRGVLDRIVESAALPAGRNALFMTYSQINVQNRQRDVVLALASRGKGAVFILDESHNAGGASNTGEFIREALSLAQGVTYLSATYAKRPDNMPVYFKTDIGDAMADDATLMAAMEAGGLPLQTVVANNLVNAGQMFRRERSYDGVSIETRADTGHRIEHEKLSDTTTSALRAIVAADQHFHAHYVADLKKQLEELGERLHDIAGNQAKESVDHTEFSSVVHNFVRQMLLGLKAQAAADEAIASLKRGEKALVAVENTMGSFLGDYAKNNGIKDGDSLGAFDYRTVLSRALERSRFIVRQLPNGDKVKEQVPLSSLDPDSRAMYQAAQTLIDGLQITIPVSPLDWMRQEITKAGYSVAEITGRDLAVDYSDPQHPVLSSISTIEKKDKVRTTRQFNSGELDAIILNVAGSTGISLHASNKFQDQRQRHMIVAQAAQDISIFMQMLGRIHRTGQVALPKYTILNADLPAEKRPTALLSAKMKSLNANTSSNTESATSVKAVDLLNKYGDQVVFEHLEENTELAEALGFPALSLEDQPDIARRATGRLALMPVAVQQQVYSEIEEQYKTLLDYLNKTNQNELEPRTFDFDAQQRKEAVLFEGKNKASPFGQDAIYGEYSVKAQGKPMLPEEINTLMAEHRGGKTGDAHAHALLADLGVAYDKWFATQPEAVRLTAPLVRAMAWSFMVGHPIGSAWRVEINGDVYNAVITNLRTTYKAAGNPFSLSRIQVTVAVNGALRSVTAAATQFKKIEVMGLGSSLHGLFARQPDNQREIAKIVTGNLLGGYGELGDTRGTIISFTKEDGTTEQGILLPKKFNFDKDVPKDYRLHSAADALKFLTESQHENIEKFGIQSRDNTLRVLPNHGGITIKVPKSRAKGGRFFLDPGLRAAMGDFVSVGSFMQASTEDAAKARQALAILMSKQALYAAPSMADSARGIVGGDEPGTLQNIKRGPSTATLLRKYGQQPASRLDATKAFGDGDRVFYAHDMDEEHPREAKNVSDLDGYAADQMLVLPQGAGQTPALRERTPGFMHWFKGSKVVEPGGEPQVMYHGTAADFDVFDRNKSREWRRPSMDTVGSWFTTEPARAEPYAADEGKNVMPVYLRIAKPKVYKTFTAFLSDMHKSAGRDPKKQNPPGGGSTDELRARLKALGHDGIRFERTDNQALFDEINDLRKQEKAERDPGEREEIRLEIDSLRKLLDKWGSSTEFDGHDVWIAFEPEQIKSAIGNSGAFDASKPSIVQNIKRAPLTASVSVELTEDGHPTFDAHNGIRLDFPQPTERFEVIPGPGQQVLSYAIMAERGFEVHGFVELLMEAGKPVSLLDIEVNKDTRSQGVASRVVATLLAVDPANPLNISNIVPAARGFWARMGVPEQDLEPGAAYDGNLTQEAFLQSQDGRAAQRATDAGDRPGAQRDTGAENRLRRAGEETPGSSHQDARVSKLARVGAQMARQGYEKTSVPVVQAARELQKLIDQHTAGKLTEGEFVMRSKILADRMSEVSATKAANRLMGERVRDVDHVRAKLLEARRKGELDPEGVAFALWALDQNPALAANLVVLVRKPGENTPEGDYNPAAEIIRLFKGGASSDTIVHEILHHAERMMPEAMQAAIRKEWARALAKAIKNGTPEQVAALRNVPLAMAGDQAAYKALTKAIQEGPLNYAEHYPLVNPSEYWAVNGARILGEQRNAAQGSIWQKIRQFLRELVQKARALVGLSSTAPIIKALHYVTDASHFGVERGGRFESARMLSDPKAMAGGVLANIAPGPIPAAVTPQPWLARKMRAKGLDAWLDATNRLQFAPGAWLFDVIGTAASPLLARIGMKAMSPALQHQMRAMKLAVQKAQEIAAGVSSATQALSPAERDMVSDIIEQELAAGVTPPTHAVRLAALMSQTLSDQSQELVALGMLSEDAASRWDGKYLPRFYESKLRKQVGDAWADAVKRLTGRTSVMKGIKGKHLKARGMWENIAVKDLADWQALGWEARDPEYEPGVSKEVRIWRDFTREERDAKGEIRDAGFRFVMGYMQTQRDLALGRMFAGMAADETQSSRLETPGWVRVPVTMVEDTGVRRYGKLGGRFVPRETMSHLSQIEEASSAAWNAYRKGMGVWKEGKTAMNPVSHMNNVVGNVAIAHLAGVSLHRGDKYVSALKDFMWKAPMVKEARDAGLFLGSMSDAELMDSLPKDLKALVATADSTTVKGARLAFDIVTLGLRRPLGAAYGAEDTYFRYLLYKDARARGATPEASVDFAQRYIFTYDDLPKGARMVRDFAIPFASYTYKLIPMALHSVLTQPVRFGAIAALAWTANAAAYAIAAGDDDDDEWYQRLMKAITDPAYRAKAKALEEAEQKGLPPWMRGHTAMLTAKTLRLGTDSKTQLPLFIDIARFVPGGDMNEVTPKVPSMLWLPQPLTPSHPLLTLAMGIMANTDSFTGKPVVDSNDTIGEITKKEAAWIWKLAAPAVAIGNSHWERGMNAAAQASGGELTWLPDFMGDYTGIDKGGQPVQPTYAALQTFGIKVKPIDLDTSERIDKGMQDKTVREIYFEVRKLKRQNNIGAITDKQFESERAKAREKMDRVREGLTVDGVER